MVFNDLSVRDERFAIAFSRWWGGVANSVLRVAHRVLPRRACVKLALFFCDTADSVGGFAGAIYVHVRDAGDFFKWLLFGRS